MNNRKDTPVELDVEIDRLQLKMYNYLTNTVGWEFYNSFPRAYALRRKGEIIPEFYKGDGEYQEVLTNDKCNVNSFFLADETRDLEGNYITQNISIIFQSNINKLYPTIPHRADEEMHKDVLSAIKKANYINQVNTLVTGVENVYSALSLNLDEESLNDISDYHVVKVDLTINYSTSCI